MVETNSKDIELGLFASPVPEVIGCTAILLTSLFFIVARLQILSNKQLGWLLSFVYSFTLVVGSLSFIHTLIINHGSVEFAVQPSYLGRGLTAFFLTGLSLDLLLGWLYYPDHLHVVTGWMHHTLYIGLLIFCLAFNLSEYFGLMCILELPTFIMGAGVMFPQFRSDFWFGVTFFCTRILYHSYSIVTWYLMAPEPIVYLLLIALLPLHLFWFRGYVLQQQRKRRTTKRHPESDPLLANSATSNSRVPDSTGNNSPAYV